MAVVRLNTSTDMNNWDVDFLDGADTQPGAGPPLSDVSFYANETYITISGLFTYWDKSYSGTVYTVTGFDPRIQTATFVISTLNLPAQGAYDTLLAEGVPGILRMSPTLSVVGSLLADTLSGDAGGNQIFSNGGGDSVNGAAGNDTIRGEVTGNTPYNDTFVGMDGNDSIDGSYGDDIINGNKGDDTIVGGPGGDTIYGGQGQDTLYGDATRSAYSAAPGGGDIVNGNIGDDLVYGGQGNDTVYGGQGNDTVYGDGTLAGEVGDDLVSGDLGNDILYGGGGADRFTIAVNGGLDRIADFRPSEGDRIQLASGTAFSLTTVDGQTALLLADGSRLTLAGVSGWSADWLVFA